MSILGQTTRKSYLFSTKVKSLWTYSLLSFGLTLLLPLIGQAQTYQSESATAGYRDFSFDGGGVTSKPTEEKPESKLWFNDGYWWGVLWDPNADVFRIHRFDPGTQNWTNVGPDVDARRRSSADALWDGFKLYVASRAKQSHKIEEGPEIAIINRYSYDPNSSTYTLDSGFPVDIPGTEKTRALVITKDSNGKIWCTWTANNKVMVNRTVGGDFTWGAAFVLPVQGTDLSDLDLSSIVAVIGNKIGIFWSNQIDDKYYFAMHKDSNSDTIWQPREEALADTSFNSLADDHINVTCSINDGTIVATVKTGLTASSNPRVYVLKRDPTNSTWSRHVFGYGADSHTRPIALLDSDTDSVYVFARVKDGNGIFMKSAHIDNLEFPAGLGTPYILSDLDLEANNPTSTKQCVNSTSGLLVLASDKSTKFYLHNHTELSGGSPPINTPPVANDDSYSAKEGEILAVNKEKGVLANDTDADNNVLTAILVSSTTNGLLALDLNGSFKYTPNAGFTGTDRFTYKANDGIDDSNTATVTITVSSNSSSFVVEAHFNRSKDGFKYKDDLFRGTHQPKYASGKYIKKGGFSGGALRVTLGGKDNATIRNMSGGWEHIFKLDASADVKLSFRYKLTQQPNYEPDEFSLVLVTVGDRQLGTDGHKYVATIAGNGNGGKEISTGWQLYEVKLGKMSSGKHRLAIGGFNNKKTFRDESTEVLIDDVLVEVFSTDNTPPVAKNDVYRMEALSALRIAAPGILSNDSDEDGDELTAVLANTTTNGVLFLNKDGSFTYTPNTGFSGTDSFSYLANDGTENSNIAEVTITVNAISDVLIDADFNKDTDGFTYLDDAFRGTSEPKYAFGRHHKRGGFTGGTLRVILGGIDNADISNMSGGWGHIFTLNAAAAVKISLRYKLTQQPNYESDEFSEMLLTVDGRQLGAQGHDYIAHIAGDGNGGRRISTGWQLFEVKLGELSAGEHKLVIGGFNNQKTFWDESTEVLIDDVLVEVGGGSTTTLSFRPTDDGQVKLTDPKRNYGTKSSARLGANLYNTYFRFKVTGVNSSGQRAKIRLFVVGGHPDGCSIYLVSNNFANTGIAWGEKTLTAKNAPEINGPPLSLASVVSHNSFVEFDVTSAVTGDGTYCFGMKTSANSQARYSTKEGKNSPELIIELQPALAKRDAETLVTTQDVAFEFDQDTTPIPEKFGLSPNYPNPFNAETSIEYALPEAAKVELVIYNLIGQEVRQLVDEIQEAGYKKIKWTGQDNFGKAVGSGVYFLRLNIGNKHFTRKLTLQK